MKLGNVLFKGLKLGAQVLAGGTAYGVLATGAGWHPPVTGHPAADALIALTWQTFGTGAVTALGAAVARWSTYDPRKDPRNK